MAEFVQLATVTILAMAGTFWLALSAFVEFVLS